MYEKELKIAVSAVKASEKTFRKYFGASDKIESKNDNYRNLVTLADKKIETDVKKFLSSRFPEYGFIGEENGHFKTTSAYSWVLDPIDGTNNFIRGLPDCSISLALLKHNRPVVGVVYAPLLNLLYTARQGNGATLNGKKIRIAKPVEIKKAFGSIGWGREIKFGIANFQKLLPQIFTLRVASSVALTLCQVAAGNFHFLVTKNMKIWDIAAGQIILAEASGILETSPSNVLIAGSKSVTAKLKKMIA